MQRYKNLLLSALLILAAMLFSNTLFAHFGSKGPYGGSVSVAISYDSTVYLGTFNGGVYESTTSTISAWRARPVGLGSGKISALAHSGSYLFAGTADAGVYIFNGYVGTDRHWVKINNGLSNLNIKSLIALDSITLLAGTDGGGLYKTTNKGGTWTAINDASVNSKTITAFAKIGNRIALATLDGGLFVSINNGNNWTSFNDANTLNIGGTISLSYNAATNELAVINNNGLFLLANASTTTTPNYVHVHAGLPVGIALRSVNNDGSRWYMATDQGAMETSGEKIIVVATEKGVFVSRDLASTYQRANKGLMDSLHVTYLRFLGAKLYASTKNAGMFVSADTGKTWVALNNGLSNLDIRKIFASNTDIFILDASNGLFQYASPNWTSFQTGLPANAIPTSMTFYGSKILLGTWGHGLFTRELANGTWSPANTGLGNLNVTSVTTNGSKLFVGTNGSGVFISDLNAANWSHAAAVSIDHTVKMGLDGTKIQDMAFYAGYVFASYKGGLLATSTNGASWIAGGNQFNLPSYTDVNKISFVTTRVFVTTEFNSVYSNALSELPTVSTYDVNSGLTASVNISPNPNNGNFVIQMEAEVKVNGVSIFDNTGKLVQQIANPGNLSNIQITGHFQSGIYFVQIRTTEGIAVKKIVIE